MVQKVLSLVSFEGGSGKTTTAINLAYVAYQKGKKVVIIDLDNNLSINIFTGIPAVERSQSIEKVFRDDFTGDWTLIDLFESEGKASLVPGSRKLNSDLISHVRRRENILSRNLTKYPLPFDLVILDNRGGSDPITDNSIVAASHVLILSRVGAKTATVGESIEQINNNIGELELDPAPKILGVLPNEKEARSVHNQIIDGAEQSLTAQGIKLYPAIPHNGWICNSNAWQIPIAAYRKKESYIGIFEQIIEELFDEA